MKEVQVDKKEPPPPGFFVWWFANQEHGGYGPAWKKNPISGAFFTSAINFPSKASLQSKDGATDFNSSTVGQNVDFFK